MMELPKHVFLWCTDFLAQERVKPDPNGRRHLMSKGETKTEREIFAALTFCNIFFLLFHLAINSRTDAATINH